MIYLLIGSLITIAAKSQLCTNDAECTPLGPEYSCEYFLPGNFSICTNQTFSFCQSDLDCMGYPAALNYTCQIFTSIVNETTGANISVPLCLPGDQCQDNTDCLSGQSCITEYLSPFNPVNFCDYNISCTSDIDCGTGFACYNSTFCVVTCTNDTECPLAGYSCGEAPGGIGLESNATVCRPDYLTTMNPTTMTPTTTDTGTTTTEALPTTTYAGCSSNAECRAIDPSWPVCDMYSRSCVICMNDTDCMGYGYDYTCQYEYIFGVNVCSNSTSQYCESNADCGVFGPGLNSTCQTVSGTVNISNTWMNITVPTCVVLDQCMNNSDCLTGSECRQLDTGFYTVNLCGLSNNTCSGDADCTAIDPSLRCYTTESTCYLPCMNDTDCDISKGWTCQSPEDGIYACLNFEVNLTMMTTTEMPTTTAPDTTTTTAAVSTTESATTTEEATTTESATTTADATTSEEPTSSMDDFSTTMGIECEFDYDCESGLFGICYDNYCVPCKETSDCTKNTQWYGDGYICSYNTCIEPCENSNDCSPWSPYCVEETGECVVCLTTQNCIDNEFYGKQSECVEGSCKYISPICDRGNDTYCEEKFGDEYSCLTDPIYNISMCSNATSPYCDTSEDCQDIDSDEFGFGTAFDFECEPVTVPVNASGVMIEITVKTCIPQDLCELDGDDCLTGSECETMNIEDIFSVNVCRPSNNTCTTDKNCTDIDPSLNCYEPEGTCYLPCQTNKDCDSENTGYYCSSPEEGIWACLPFGFDNVTRYTTNAPSVEPSAAPTEPPIEDPNTAGVEQLAIFGGMIVMIIHVLSM